MKKKLIVNADDFGQSTGINKGIIKAFEDGILTSTSLMVRYPDAEHAVKYAMANNLDMGLHVDLGEWTLRDGNWDALYEVVNMDDIDAVYAEIQNQLDKFIRLTGVNPSHIDSHQHVHQKEKLKPLFLQIASRLNITLRGCSGRVKYCGDFYGQSYDFSPFPEAISAENLKKIILNLPDGITEMACHPGMNVEIQTMYKAERETEVNSLCSPIVQEAIDKTGTELCDFKNIPF